MDCAIKAITKYLQNYLFVVTLFNHQFLLNYRTIVNNFAGFCMKFVS